MTTGDPPGGESSTSGKRVDYQARVDVHTLDSEQHRQPQEHCYKHRD
jgi:hypothetical protein